MSDRVEVRGAARLRSTLAAAGRDLADLDAAHAEAGRIALSLSRPPVRTGALRASQKADTENDTTTLTAAVRYAVPVHQGTARVTARPFLTDAITRAQPRIEDVFAAAADKTINQVKGI